MSSSLSVSQNTRTQIKMREQQCKYDYGIKQITDYLKLVNEIIVRSNIMMDKDEFKSPINWCRSLRIGTRDYNKSINKLINLYSLSIDDGERIELCINETREKLINVKNRGNSIYNIQNMISY